MIKRRETALGQGSLACHGPWDRKQLDMTEGLNNNPVSEETHPADFGLWPPEPRENLSFKLPSLWYFIIAAWAG